jgi:hypothetical protein
MTRQAGAAASQHRKPVHRVSVKLGTLGAAGELEHARLTQLVWHPDVLEQFPRWI